jgi:hypothetical protein
MYEKILLKRLEFYGLAQDRDQWQGLARLLKDLEVF